MVLLSVKEPVWNLECAWVGYNNHELLQLLCTELTSPVKQTNNVLSWLLSDCCCTLQWLWLSDMVLRHVCTPLLEVNLSLLAHNVGESPSQTPDRGHGVHDVLLAVNIGVQHTQNMLEVVCGNQGLHQEGQRSVKSSIGYEL